MERTRQGRWTRQDSAAHCPVDRRGVCDFHADARGNLAASPRGRAVPERDATLADSTLDANGELDKPIDLHRLRGTLRLHAPNGEADNFGASLVCAYQKSSGDLHDPSGEPNAVHVAVYDDGSDPLGHGAHRDGDGVADVRGDVEYGPQKRVRRVRYAARRGVSAHRTDIQRLEPFMQRYEEGLRGYTYLQDSD